MEESSNTLRILVATDCHLGYMEKDEIRRNDSFCAFEEICTIAGQKEVDFILLGGDLFHENKPSRPTLVKTIEILRNHCLNDRPVQFKVVSDQTVNFTNSYGHVNYEDPHFNVGMPVFSIHGNHDDPAGVDNLSAVDILSACNLLNYFGKMILEGSGVGEIAVYPILIRKGTTAVALYGLGNIRDERLNRMFQTPHAIQWMRPEAQGGCQVSDWFNILVLHQNRVKMNPKNAINEHFLPRFLDFIVWGHEHECLIDPREVAGLGFHITQPGSSVATSLIDGESKPKHVLLLEIKGNQYRPTKIPLASVRPFEYTEIVLKDEADVNPNDPDSIVEHLDKVVTSLIEKSRHRAGSRSELKLPLVRIKVDYSGFITINPQRFGQKYVGKVANPQDILIFSKTSRKNRTEAKVDDSELFRPEELNQQNIEALVAESNLKMEILPVNDLDVALQNFVNKDEKTAFYSCVQYNLQETRTKITKSSDSMKFNEEDIILKVEECFEERIKGGSAPCRDDPLIAAKSQPIEVFRNTTAAQVANTVSFSDHDDDRGDDDDDDDVAGISCSKSTMISQKRKREPIASPVVSDVRKGKSTRGRGRKRGSGGLKQMTMDSAIGFRQPERPTPVTAAADAAVSAADVDDVSSASSGDANEDESLKGRKSVAPRAGRSSVVQSKRGRKAGNASIQRMLTSKDANDDDNEWDFSKKLRQAQPRASRNYGALRR